MEQVFLVYHREVLGDQVEVVEIPVVVVLELQDKEIQEVVLLTLVGVEEEQEEVVLQVPLMQVMVVSVSQMI